MIAQQRLSLTWASTYSDHSLRFALNLWVNDPVLFQADSEASDQTESLLGAQAILLVLSYCGSNIRFALLHRNCIHM